MYKMMPEERHLMVDLETLGSHNNAVITQIGGCIFQPCAEEPIIKSFCFHVDPQSCLDIGLGMQWATIKWWMQQSEEARAAFQRTDTISIKQALANLCVADWKAIQCIWSHGLTFDVPILENALKKTKMDIPWSFKAGRDTRTLFWLQDPDWPENKLKHSAEHDAIAQAIAVTSALRKLGAAKVEKKNVKA